MKKIKIAGLYNWRCPGMEMCTFFDIVILVFVVYFGTVESYGFIKAIFFALIATVAAFIFADMLLV